MPPHRNDPCPCGSGRKYKRCCWDRDQAASPLTLVRDGDAALPDEPPPPVPPPGAPWEIDLVPLPITFDDDPDARPTAVLVVSDGLVLYHDILSDPPAGVVDVANQLGTAYDVAVARTGVEPSRILVRHEAVMARLRTDARFNGKRVQAGPLPSLEHAAASLAAHLAGVPKDRPVHISTPQTWKAWRLPRELVAALFRAAAAYHRLKPWGALANEQLLAVTCPSATTWTVSVLGAGGMQFGLALYDDPLDFERQVSAASPPAGFKAIKGAILSLTFDRRADLPPPMRKEILASGWEIAGPDAHPSLAAFNTPGGGVTVTQAEDLCAALRAVARFADRYRAELRNDTEDRLAWQDAETGVAVTYEAPGALPPALWPRPETLASALPQGPGADPEAACRAHDEFALQTRRKRLLAEFQESLLDSGLSKPTVIRHTENAALLLNYLNGYEAIPLQAMTEYDLRAFLYDWCIRKVLGPTTAIHALPASLKRFLSFVAQREQLNFPWAAAILTDKRTFLHRLDSFERAGRANLDEWTLEFIADLADRELLPDPGMAGGGEWGATQGDVEYVLHRELCRRWLLWRDEEIATGNVTPVDVGKELLRRQRAWERAPHDSHGGLTPVQLVAREREGIRRGERD